MDTRMTATDQLYDYDVMDSSGNKLGSVDGVWADDATGRPEFVSIRTGWIFGKTHLIPVGNAQIDDGSQTISVPYGSDQIKNGPSFPTDADISPDEENQIYDYYGLQRSTQTSPTGYAGGGGPTNTPDTTDQGEVDVPVSEEELKVGKRQVEAGRARLHKVVRTEHEEVPVNLQREEIDIERVPASGQSVPTDAFQEREVEVPVMREEPVVAKDARVTGEVRVGKRTETQQETVGGDVRREEVEIDRDTDTEGTDDFSS